MTTTKTQQRTVEWVDPSVSAQAALRLSGLEFLHAIMAGELPSPPFAELTRSRMIAATNGSVTFTCDVDESMYNPIGSVHGGLVCTLLDSVLGCAVQTTLPTGTGYTSVETNVQFHRGVQATSGPLTAVGRVTKPGKRIAFAEGEVTDVGGNVVARGYGTVLVITPNQNPQ